MSRSTKRDLLAAAELIVRRDGSARLTLEGVAAEAGVSKGGLLYHFPSKDALVSAMVERMLSSFDQALDQAMAQDPVEPGRRTRAWVRASASSPGLSERDTAAGLLAAMATNPALAGPMRERHAQWRQKTERDGISAEDAMIVSLAADGLWMADLLGFSAPAGDDRRRIVARMLEIAAGAP